MIQIKCASFVAVVPLIAGLSIATPTSSFAQESVNEALLGGKFLVNVRVRYEFVDQDGISENADAKTARVRLGYETGGFYGVSVLAEIDGTTNFGGEEFNSKENGQTQYPVVADPDSFRLNRLNLKYTGIPDTVLKAGRQRIKLDDDRFIGNVGWRQNEQTFDSIRITNTSIDGVKVNYVYVWGVNGILGSDAVLGDWDSNSHLFDVTYSGFKYANITGFGHWFDFEDAKEGSSLATYGVRLDGKVAITDDVTALYAGTYAYQEDNAGNTADVDNSFYSVIGGVSWNGFTGKVGYDIFEGDGADAFQTPLATGHKFQGFADVFLTTPADGLEDAYVSLSYKSKPFSFFKKGVTGTIAYHKFDAEDSSVDMGSEFDAVVAIPLYDNFKVVGKYAVYDGDGFAANRQKFMLGINFNL